jgi:hypothetical protein
MNARKIALIAGLGVAGLSLIGAGAGATFTDAVQTTQTITAGSIDVQLTSTDASVTVSSDGKTATFAPQGPTQSTFSGGAVPTVITNLGTATANAILLGASDVHGANAASQALAAQTCVRITSPINGAVAYDGKLSGLEASPLHLTGPVAPKGTDSFVTEFYAGGTNAAPGCDSLNNAAEGGVLTPTVTVSYQG